MLVEGSVVYELNPLLSMELEPRSEQLVEAMTLVVQLFDIPIHEAIMQRGMGDVPVRLSLLDSDSFNFMPLIEQSARLSTKHGRGRPKPILVGKMGLHGSDGDKVGDKRKQMEDISLVLPVIVSADQGGGKHRLCINGSTGQAEETSVEESSKSQC